MTEKSAEQLIDEHQQLDAYITAETKRFSEFMAPYKQRLEEISNAILAKSNEDKWQNISTQSGWMAYRTTHMDKAFDQETPYANANGETVFGRNALLDFCLEHWDTYGSEMLM